MGFADQYALKQYYQRMNALNKQLDEQYTEFVWAVDREYRIFAAGVEYVMLSQSASPEERMKKSVQIAKKHNLLGKVSL